MPGRAVRALRGGHAALARADAAGPGHRVARRGDSDLARARPVAPGGPGLLPGPRRHAPLAGAALDDRPAAARLPRLRRLAAHRPVAGHADPVRVRQGVRRARRARAGGQRLRLGPHPPGRAGVRPRRGGRPGARRGRLRRHHRRRAGGDGGRQQGGARGRGHLGRARHRAALRGGAQRARRPRGQLPLLLRPQDDVRQVRVRLRRPARAASAPSTSSSRRSPSSRPRR